MGPKALQEEQRSRVLRDLSQLIVEEKDVDVASLWGHGGKSESLSSTLLLLSVHVDGVVGPDDVCGLDVSIIFNQINGVGLEALGSDLLWCIVLIDLDSRVINEDYR